MPPIPCPGFVTQCDKDGKQIVLKQNNWLTALCNCFRVTNSSYSLQKDLPLLLPQEGLDIGKNTLVLDLDETLIHSTFTEIQSDIKLKIQVENQDFQVFVLKRPGVDEFLEKCYESFEVVVFTASLSNYANPLLDLLDPERKISHRLFRESCSEENGFHIKDLARLGRDLRRVVIVDNSPVSYKLQPDNAIPIRTWISDKGDRDLESLWMVLKEISQVDDIPKVLMECRMRSKDLTLDSVREVVNDRRAGFNSPVNAAGNKFEFATDRA